MRCYDMVNGSPGGLKTLEDMVGRRSGSTPWELYNRLINGIPDDVYVLDYAVGVHWSCLLAECGAGVSYTLTGGGASVIAGDLRGLPLRDVASLAKSWNFEEATIGVAALGAWYGQRSLLESMGAVFETSERSTDAFAVYEPEIRSFVKHGRRANVVVVGHFPNLGAMCAYSDLTVLERNCRSAMDTPDSACEYVIPEADFAFLTGVTLINKTAPRLIALCGKAETVFVGPSVVASPAFFDCGVSAIAGRAVVDPDGVRKSVVSGLPFGESLQSFIIRR